MPDAGVLDRQIVSPSVTNAALGDVGRGAGHKTASSDMAFAKTWALGQLAQ